MGSEEPIRKLLDRASTWREPDQGRAKAAKVRGFHEMAQNLDTQIDYNLRALLF